MVANPTTKGQIRSRDRGEATRDVRKGSGASKDSVVGEFRRPPTAIGSERLWRYSNSSVTLDLFMAAFLRRQAPRESRRNGSPRTKSGGLLWFSKWPCTKRRRFEASDDKPLSVVAGTLPCAECRVPSAACGACDFG